MAGPLLFNTSFIIDPRGEIILKHWKHNHNAFLLPYTSPCDVYDEFIRRYGRKALLSCRRYPFGPSGLSDLLRVYVSRVGPMHRFQRS